MSSTTGSANATSSSAPWPIKQRQRTSSRLSLATTSTTSVSVAGLPTQTDIEQKAHSRNTLSRHLSQSNLLGVAAPAQDQPHSGARQRSESLKSDATTGISLNESSASRQVASSPAPSPTRRSSTYSPRLPRSPSYSSYPTLSRKSSLAVPQLSTIEGSVADLKEEETRWLREQGLSPSQTPGGDATRPDISDEPGQMNKRPANSETETAEIEKLVKKKKSWLGPVRQPQTGTNSTAASSPPQPASTDLQDSKARDTARPLSVPHEDVAPSVGHASAEVPALPSQAVSVSMTSQPSKTSVSSDGWLNYLTLGRVSRPASIAPSSTSPVTAHPPDRSSQETRSPNLADDSVMVFGKEHRAEQPGDREEPNIQKQPEPHAVQQVHLEPVATAVTLRPTPSRSSLPRPASWWAWSTVPSDTCPSDAPEALVVARAADRLHAADPLDKEATSAATTGATSSESQTSSTVPVHQSDSPMIIDAPKPGDDTQTVTWSSWLGSYLSTTGAAQTTTMTYGLGLAPESAASTSASSVASTIAPEADESFPPDPPSSVEEPEMNLPTPTVTLHRNPLLDNVPRSSWSSFFTSRYTYPRRVVDSKAGADPGEPEVMEVDFGSLGPQASSSVSSTSTTRAQISSVTPEQARLDGALSSNAIFRASEKQVQAGRTASSSRTSSIAHADTTRPGTISPGSAVGQSSQAMATTSSASSVRSAFGGGKQSKATLTESKLARGGTKPSSSSSSRVMHQPAKASRPNLVLPSFEDTFNAPPRSIPPFQPEHPAESSMTVKRAAARGFTWLFSSSTPAPEEPAPSPTRKGKEREIVNEKSERLPKPLHVLGQSIDFGRNGRVCIIGVHGWFIQSYLKNVVGEPTGTSTKFATMMKDAVKAYYAEKGHALNDEAITAIPLEGDGTVNDRLARLYENLMARQDWVDALNNADKVFIVAHSQGCIVSTMLLSRLINEGEVLATRCAMLMMCGVSQGPFVSLYNSWTSAYLYWETAAARELFEFQKPYSAPSKQYMESMQHVLNAGTKVLLVASLNDQVVPLYSALFSSLSHPSILRAIFIDSQAFETSADFMTDLVVFSTRLRNAGLSSHGLDFHLSEALAGSLMGVGHSTIYDEAQVYRYAVRYLLETSGPLQPSETQNTSPEQAFNFEPFDPRVPTNPYFLPWALRGVIDDHQIRTLFADELGHLRSEFEKWSPKTKALQQVKMALEPLRGIPRPRSNDEIDESKETGKDPNDKKAAAKL